MRELDSAQQTRVRRDLGIRELGSGNYVCRKGGAVEHWFGVIDGLVKISSVSPDGKSVTFIGVPAGGWFGEGSLLKDEPRRYDAVALRAGRIACMPRSTFQWLLDTSISFNRHLLLQLNERLGQFVATIESDRLLGPDARVARCLAQMFNPLLYPGSGPRLEISQAELGFLTGLSRQRVNQALQALERANLVTIEYGSITVLSLSGLREFEG
ncbi:MAG: Crp/Fnr family transcriptional regulator [Burkholderiaceae bacterium]